MSFGGSIGLGSQTPADIGPWTQACPLPPSSLSLDVPIALVAQGTQINMPPNAPSSTTLRHPHGFQWQPRPHISTQNFSCSTTTDLDMALGAAWTQDFILVPHGHGVPPVPPFSTVHKALGFAFSSISLPCTPLFPSLDHTFVHPRST